MMTRRVLDRISNFNNAGSLSAKFRKKRFDRFRELLPFKRGQAILDLGGSETFWLGTEYEEAVTIVNLNIREGRSQRMKWVKGDACNLPMFEDRSFSIVFSNSVIEHVGAFDRQHQMASEIRRVGERYWVQTPYKHFPVEPHFLFPFFQYLPWKIRRTVARHWPLSYSKLLSLDPEAEAAHIWLINKPQMSELFHDGLIIHEKVLGLTKSLIAVKQ